MNNVSRLYKETINDAIDSGIIGPSGISVSHAVILGACIIADTLWQGKLELEEEAFLKED